MDDPTISNYSLGPVLRRRIAYDPGSPAVCCRPTTPAAPAFDAAPSTTQRPQRLVPSTTPAARSSVATSSTAPAVPLFSVAASSTLKAPLSSAVASSTYAAPASAAASSSALVTLSLLDAHPPILHKTSIRPRRFLTPASLLSNCTRPFRRQITKLLPGSPTTTAHAGPTALCPWPSRAANASFAASCPSNLHDQRARRRCEAQP